MPLLKRSVLENAPSPLFLLRRMGPEVMAVSFSQKAEALRDSASRVPAGLGFRKGQRGCACENELFDYSLLWN